MVELRRVHWVATKHVLMYLCGTMEFGLMYVRVGGVQLLGYIDLDGLGVQWTGKNT